MHEKGLTDSLLKKILHLAHNEKATKVTQVSVCLGALTNMSPSHFKEHFVHASLGTLAEGASLIIEESSALDDPNAPYVTLKNIEVL